MAYAKAHRHPEQTDKTVWEVFEEERPHLVPYVGPFDGFHSVPASVPKTCTVRFDNNKYSVMATAVGRHVEVHAYAEQIVIRHDGLIVGEHARAFGRGQTIYKSAPLVADFRLWLTLQRARISAKSRLGEKLGYIHRHWGGLQVFLSDGRVEMDTNPVENTIRPITLNRKNPLCAGQDEGGPTWARMAWLI